MGQFIDQIEALTDNQRTIENYYAYTDKYLAKVGEKLTSDNKWRVALKWSTKVSNACVEDEEGVMKAMRKVNTLAQSSQQSLNSLAKTFEKNARTDYNKWDCNAMYPMPIQHKVDPIKLISEAVKEGMAIFNEIKGMLPEGTMANLKIPGLPAGMQANVEKGVKMFQQGQEVFKQFSGDQEDEFMDFEEDLIEEKALGGLIGGESDADFKKRVDLRNRYVATCNKGKKEFGDEI